MGRESLVLLFCVLLWAGCPSTTHIRQEKGSERSVTPKESPQQVDGKAERREDIPDTKSVEIVKERTVDVKTTPWGALKIVDIHAHIGTFSGYDLSLSNLIENMRRYGVKTALISNIDGANLPGTTANLDEKKANQATVLAVQKYPSMLRGIAWTRPNDGKPDLIEPFVRDAKLKDGKSRVFVAMKFHPDMNQFSADGASLNGYMKLCEKYDLVAVFHCGGKWSHSDPEKIYTLAKRFPKVAVVLYHMGFSGEHQFAIDVVKRSLQKKDARIFLGTAQADPNAVVKAIKELGSEAVMFGTDATYYGKAHYEKYEKMINLMKSSLTQRQLDDVLRDNAKRLFRLP
ncbi:MAG: hypothetical protein CL920_11685 [Deltaproteobacteria bacterium]|nr:hypothetical protein [Deltaproteobacteria bacterium]|tara:strand:+ start:56175 stop:57206 length:1032 start_codon:yes stop_codon:yes gene_type:complete